MSEYQKRKEAAREKAMQFIYNCNMGVLYSWYDIARIQDNFERLAHRYGLLREFRENGLI